MNRKSDINMYSNNKNNSKVVNIARFLTNVALANGFDFNGDEETYYDLIKSDFTTILALLKKIGVTDVKCDVGVDDTDGLPKLINAQFFTKSFLEAETVAVIIKHTLARKTSAIKLMEMKSATVSSVDSNGNIKLEENSVESFAITNKSLIAKTFSLDNPKGEKILNYIKDKYVNVGE